MIWLGGRERLVEEESKEGELAENLAMAGSFMCHSKMNKEREMHDTHVNRSLHDVEEVMSMSDFDNDKNRSRYI